MLSTMERQSLQDPGRSDRLQWYSQYLILRKNFLDGNTQTLFHSQKGSGDFRWNSYNKLQLQGWREGFQDARFIRTICIHRIRWSCEGLMSVHNELHWISFEAFIAETYVQLAATDANVLRAQALCSETSYSLVRCPGLNWLANASHTVLCGDLYTACVDTSRMVFWDRSVLR